MEVFNLEQWTPEWYEMRRWVITWTRLARLMGGKEARKTLIYELIGEEITDFDPNVANSAKSDAMAHWNDSESIIRSEFIQRETVSVGFIKKCAWIGISPDALVQEGEIYTEAYEFKAPQATNFVRYAIENKSRWDIPSEYLWQVVHYFVCIDSLEKLHFWMFNENVKDKDCRMVWIEATRESLRLKIEEAMASISSFKVEWDTAKKTLVSALK